MKCRKGSSILILALVINGFLATGAMAADLININTADSATLQTLNGIGPSKAQAIIDYRTQHGPFAAIEDIQNVSGIGPATYANIKDYITVGDTTSYTPAQTQTGATTTSASQTQAQSGASSVPPPITAAIDGDVHTAAGAGAVYQGEAYGTAGEPLTSGVRYMWNFGDGEVGEGARVLHTYHYPGTYALTLSVAYDYQTASMREVITAVAPMVSLVAQGDGSLTVYNRGSSDLDIGLWSIVDGATAPFVIPEDTSVLAGQGVRFAAGVTHLSGSPRAQLLYPNGTNAASATVAGDSPLRGEVVAATESPASGYGDLPAGKSPEVGSSSLAKPPTSGDSVAAVADAGSPSTLWMIAGFLCVLALGGASGWYVSRLVPARAATSMQAEEFEIEE